MHAKRTRPRPEFIEIQREFFRAVVAWTWHHRQCNGETHPDHSGPRDPFLLTLGELDARREIAAIAHEAKTVLSTIAPT